MTVQAFVITSGYCNCLMYGINDGLMQRRQAVGKAARLVTGTHIIPVLRQLRWLPVRADELSLK